MIKLSKILKEGEERQSSQMSTELKKHFLEIVSTYNKYQEQMDRKSDLATIAETLGGITEAARALALNEGDDWFDKVTIKRNMNELEKLGKEFDKCANEANSLDQRMGGLYEDMGHILSRYYKLGEISEDQMKQRLGITSESVNEAPNTKKRFMFDFYTDSFQRNTERETNFMASNLDSAIKAAEHMCKVTGYAYVEIYYKDLFLGSMKKQNGFKFVEGRGYKKYILTHELNESTNKSSHGCDICDKK
jgi:hypothetical protein